MATKLNRLFDRDRSNSDEQETATVQRGVRGLCNGFAVFGFPAAILARRAVDADTVNSGGHDELNVLRQRTEIDQPIPISWRQ